MTNMRVLAFVCWMLAFQSIVIGPIVYARNRHRRAADQRDVGDLEDTANPRSRLSLLRRSSMTNASLFRDKRNEKVEEEALPTRHAKHRKRRRCRNRSTCLRGPLAGQRANETKQDQDSSNTMTETEEMPREQSEVIDRVQDSYNETKAGDYNVTNIDEEKSRIATKGESVIVAERNTFDDDYLTDTELMDTYDDLSTSGEDEFGKDRSKKDDIIYTHPSIVYSAIDDQIAIHESLSVLFSKLFQSLRNASAADNRDIFRELNFVNGSNEDPCQRWLNSRDKLEQVFLGGLASLPACPCQYPSSIFYDDKIWDERHKRHFRWRDVSGDSQRLDVYKPGAAYCVRSLLTQGSGSAAAQHCCYDRRRKLLTRGSGAGTPNFVSPEISPVLHERIDVLPWRLCKGDFSRYNGARPPNNDNGCEANPDNEEYQRQIDNTKYY